MVCTCWVLSVHATSRPNLGGVDGPLKIDLLILVHFESVAAVHGNQSASVRDGDQGV